MSAPMCLPNSRMKDTQNLRISLSDLPLGSKSAPPLPPPMFTIRESVKHVLQTSMLLVEIRTACQSILEGLLEAQEFQYRQVDRGVESETALVRTQGRVELHTVPAVDLELALVIFPDDTELDDSFGDCGDLKRLFVFWVLFEERGMLKGRGKLCGVPVSVARGDLRSCMGSWKMRRCRRRWWGLTFVRLLELGLGREVRHDGR